MNQYFSKTFISIEPAKIDHWLNSFQKTGFGVRVVGYVNIIGAPMILAPTILVTIVVFKLGQIPPVAEKPLTIDAIPEDPSIDYGEQV